MPYQHTTLATLRARLRDRTETVPFWTDAEATLALNEGLKLWNLFTGQWRTPASLGTVLGSPYVALPGPLLWPARMTWNGAPLAKVARSEIDAAKPGWQTQTIADGGIVPTKVSAWVPHSLGLVGIWPQGAGTLAADGIADTPLLVNAGDFVDLSESQLTALTGYGLHYLSLKTPLFAQTLGLRAAFLRAAGEQNASFRASAYYRTAMAGDPDRKRQPLRAPDATPAPVDQAIGEDDGGA